MNDFFRIVALVCCISLIVVFQGCSLSSTPFLYRQKIEQGNIVTAERMQKIQLGMNPSQVHYVLGSPSFIDPFHPERWNYFFKVADSQKHHFVHSLILVFEDNALRQIIGNPSYTDQISELLDSKRYLNK